MKIIKKILEQPFLGRQERLAAGRLTMSKTDFVNNLASSEIGRRAALLLWDKLQDEKCSKDFYPHPDDNLANVFGLAEEDLDEDIILYIFRSLDITPPDSKVMMAFGPIETPRDIVRLIELGGSLR